jgi:hypothetical protein
MSLHLQGTVPRLDKMGKGISPQLAAVVAHAMQRNPEERCSDMHTLIHELDHLESIDISILDRVEEPARELPFWRSQFFVSVLMALVVLLVLIVIAFGLQALHK